MKPIEKQILKIILSEKQPDITEYKYNIVISALSKNYHLEEICNYIIRSFLNLSSKPKTSLQEYFITKAYEYLVYLNNAHEPSHEVERLL